MDTIKEELIKELQFQAIPECNIFANFKCNEFVTDFLYNYTKFSDNISHYDLSYAFGIMRDGINYVAICRYTYNDKDNTSFVPNNIIEQMNIYVYERLIHESDLMLGIYEEKHAWLPSINMVTGEPNIELFLPSAVDIIYPILDDNIKN